MGHHKPVAAVDARTLVPVTDDAGGVVVYVGGRAAYYVLNGEWFAALPERSREGRTTWLDPRCGGSGGDADRRRA